MPKKYKVSASSSLTLTDSALDNTNEAESVVEPLVFGSNAVINHIIKVVSDSLNITESLSKNTIFFNVSSDQVSLNESIFIIRAYYEQASDSLIIVENAQSIIKSGVASDILNISEEIKIGRPIYVSVESNLTYPFDELPGLNFDFNSDLDVIFAGYGLREEVSVQFIHSESVTSYLSFGDQAASSKICIASDQLFITESVETAQFGNASDILNITETITTNLSGPITDVLTLTDNVVNTGIYPRAVSENFVINDVVSYLILDYCNYGLGVGEGSFEITAPPAEEPTLVPGANVIFTYPYSVPTITLPLRKPNFDNVTQLEVRKINRRSRGGTLQIFRDNAWPTAERLILTFSALKQTEITNLFNFLQKSLGKEIGYLDHEGRQWKGIILTPSAQMSEVSLEGFSASVEIEGIKV